jgi:hypothetical protein
VTSTQVQSLGSIAPLPCWSPVYPGSSSVSACLGNLLEHIKSFCALHLELCACSEAGSDRSKLRRPAASSCKCAARLLYGRCSGTTVRSSAGCSQHETAAAAAAGVQDTPDDGGTQPAALPAPLRDPVSRWHQPAAAAGQLIQQVKLNTASKIQRSTPLSSFDFDDSHPDLVISLAEFCVLDHVACDGKWQRWQHA